MFLHFAILSLFVGCKKIEKENKYNEVINVLNRIEEEYPSPMSEKEITQKALHGIFKTLDPYSVYLPNKYYKTFTDIKKGKITGIGLELIEDEGKVLVMTTLPGSPSEKVGIKSGDIITHINDSEITGYDIQKLVIEKLRGNPGTPVSIIIKRKNKQIKFLLLREVVYINPVKYTIYKDIIYMRIAYFTTKTASKIKKVLKIYPKAKGIIIDLRNNHGGDLESAIDCSSLFLRENKLIVNIKSRLEEYNKSYFSSNNISEIPLVVLVNKGSASSSEIFASAMQDHNRAKIIGTKTFGKGTIQEIYPIRQYGGYKMTVAYFLTPNGLEINKNGITPDIIIEDPEVIDTRIHWEKMMELDLPFKNAVQFLGQYK